MPILLGSSLWAVHISDGVLAAPWWSGGLVVAAVLALLGAWRIRDEEIPQRRPVKPVATVPVELKRLDAIALGDDGAIDDEASVRVEVCARPVAGRRRGEEHVVQILSTDLHVLVHLESGAFRRADDPGQLRIGDLDATREIEVQLRGIHVDQIGSLIDVHVIGAQFPEPLQCVQERRVHVSRTAGVRGRIRATVD